MVDENNIESRVREILQDVKDPEIPTISLLDLGVITEVSVDENDFVKVEMTPTFVGCPAMDYMKKDVENKLEEKGFKEYSVNVSLDKPWTTNNISERGRRALKEHGLAPPPHLEKIVDIDILENVKCPYCESDNTELQTPFGPTLCRSMHFCHSCKQAFEQFKPL